MPQVSDPTQIWQKVKAELTELLPQDIFDSWFANVDSGVRPTSAVVLQVANEFSAIWINDNYLDLLSKAFSDFVSGTVAFKTRTARNRDCPDSNRVADAHRSAIPVVS